MPTPRSPKWPQDPDAPIPAQYQALIFDCDGTVVDTMPVHFTAWRKALSNHNLHLSEERFYALAGATAPEVVAILAKEQSIPCDADVVAKEKEELYQASLRDLEPIHSVVEIARRECGRRKLAIASGGRKINVCESLSIIDVDHLFQVIVAQEDVAHGKPAPDLFLKAAALLQVPPAACIVYEDGDLGLQAAERAGMAWIDVRPWYRLHG
jgi:HAD superfamily hydrolase (TIGR01509 family)